MRWLWLPLALGVALAALYALLTGPVRLDPAMARAPVAAGGNAAVDSAGASSRHAHGEIREPSRRKLREILREADGEGRR